MTTAINKTRPFTRRHSFLSRARGSREAAWPA